MQRGLAHQAYQGSFWVFSGTGIQGLLQLLVLVMLARLLAPEDFGIVSAALVVIGFSLIFSLLGIGPAVIQRSRLTQDDIATAFVITVSFGLILMGAILWLAPIISTWFRIEALDTMLRGIAPVFVAEGIAVVPEALMRRAFRFKALAVVQVGSFSLGYGVVGISTAYLGFGAWALVFAHLAQVFIKVACILFIQPCPHRIVFRLSSAKAMLRFGSGLTAAQLGNYVASYGDKAITGRWLGAHNLGIYSVAFQLMLMPAAFFGQVIDQLLFPLMSRVSDEPKRLSKAYTAGLALNALIILPITALMFELAPELILVVFGTQWAAAIIPFKILSLGMLFRSSSKIADSLVRAKGAVYRGAARHWSYAIMIVVGTLIGLRWGVVGVAAGVTVALLANFVLIMKLSADLTEVSWPGLARILVHPLALSSVIWLVTAVIGNFLRSNGFQPASILGLSVSAALVVLVAIVLAFPLQCLGRDGLWIASSLAEYLPDSLAVVKRRLLESSSTAS